MFFFLLHFVCIRSYNISLNSTLHLRYRLINLIKFKIIPTLLCHCVSVSNTILRMTVGRTYSICVCVFCCCSCCYLYYCIHQIGSYLLHNMGSERATLGFYPILCIILLDNWTRACLSFKWTLSQRQNHFSPLNKLHKYNRGRNKPILMHI